MGAAILGSGNGLILLDRFADINGTNLVNHRMNIGSGWSIQGGSYTISDNKAVGSGFIAANANKSDVTVRATLIPDPVQDQATGLLLRYTDNNNLWYASINSVTTKVDLVEANAGNFNQRSVSPAGIITANRSYVVEVRCRGTTISVLVDGNVILTYSLASHNLLATHFGLASGGNGIFDNFEVF